MNDRYLFRGKRKDNGEWIEGNLINCDFFNNDGFPIFYILDIDNIQTYHVHPQPRQLF